MKTKPKTPMREYLLLVGLFILATLNGFSQYQPIDESGLQKIYVSTTGSDSGTGQVDLTISDIMGRQVFERKVAPEEPEGIAITVSRNVFTNGIYFIKAENKAGIYKVAKIIVFK